MNWRLALALVLALASTGALNWGYFAQQEEASSLPPLSIRHPLRSVLSLFENKRWLAGFLVMVGGWAFYVVALRFGPLSLVQAVSAGGIGVLAVLVQRVAHVRLAWHEWLGVGLATGGRALLAVSLVGGSTGGGQGHWRAVALWVLVAAAVACLAAAGFGRSGLAPGAGLGIAAGLLFAAGDIATKAAIGGGTRLAFVPVLLSCQLLGFVFLQLGFQRGSAIATAGVATLFTNALPIAAGVFVFGDLVPGGALGILRIAAFVVVTAGAALLASPEGSKSKTAARP